MATKITASSLHQSQLEKLAVVLEQHPCAVILLTSDEKTGKRFGQAAKRAGSAVKIGSGGRNKGQRGYQIWASWAECDK